MKRLIHFLLAGTTLVLSGTGCIVDREYDWDKLDPEITVLKTGFTYPLGVNEKKTLGSLFGLDNSSMIVADEKGDYYLKVQPDPSDVSVKISEDGDLTCVFKPVTYMLSAIPASLKGDKPDLSLDWSQSELILGLDSRIPASFRFGVDFDTFWGTDGRRSFSFTGLPVVPGKSTVTVKDENLFNPIPDGVFVKDIKLDADPDQVALLTRGETYVVTVSPVFQVPVAFTAGTQFHDELPFSLLYKLVGKIRVRQILIDMLVINTVPLEMSLSGHFVDSEGRRLEDISVAVDGKVPAGTLESPSETRLEIILYAPSPGITSDRFVLELTGLTTEQTAGLHFNKNQGVVVKDVRVQFPEGVQIDVF
jgi:hypothetical protein